MAGTTHHFPNRIMSDVYINGVNCVILVVALTLIVLIYVVFIGLYCLMSGCGVVNLMRKILGIFTSKFVKTILQITSYTFIIVTISCDIEVLASEDEQVLDAVSVRTVLSVFGFLYLVYSSYHAIQWFSSTRYPSSCFSPSQLKTFLNRLKTLDKHCRIKVKGNERFRLWRKCLSKDFVPHLWTETCELIDISGVRPNRIESAHRLSDILEEFLSQKKVFILDIGIDLEAEDTVSMRNTNKFVSKVLETASTVFETTHRATFCVSIPSLTSEAKVETVIPIKDGALDLDSERLKTGMRGPRMTALIHRELDLPAFWYFIWKHRNTLMVASIIFPPIGLFLEHLLEDVWQRHNLDIIHKYSFVPQTDAPYQMDKSLPEIPDIDFSEPQKITILLPSERFLLPRDSLSKIITGQMDLRQGRPLHRVSSTESSPPILTPHASRMGELAERAEEYRRSRASTSSEGEKLSPPPSYTAVFDKEAEGLTPPPDYSRARAREGGQSPSFFREA